MRINIYSQELTPEVILISEQANTGIEYHAVRFIMHSSERLHHPPRDDDRSAVTFWLPKSFRNRVIFSNALMDAAKLVMEAPRDTGLD